jgi:hypothetical protein
MIESSARWQAVEEKLKELQNLVENNWDKGEWELAVLGESTLRTVEQSKTAAANMRQCANEYIKTVRTLKPKPECNRDIDKPEH